MLFRWRTRCLEPLLVAVLLLSAFQVLNAQVKSTTEATDSAEAQPRGEKKSLKITAGEKKALKASDEFTLGQYVEQIVRKMGQFW